MHKAWEISGKARMYLCIRLAFLLAAASAGAAEHHGQIVFNGFGVPGAVVTASRGEEKYSAITDAHGRYSFSELADGAWNIQIEMQAFSSIRQDVTIGPGAAAGQWELKILPLDQIPDLKEPIPSVAPPSSQTSEKTGKDNAPAPTNTQTPFQRTEVNAIDTRPAPQAGTDAASAILTDETFGEQDMSYLSLRAADGFLINGTTHNSASSPFAQNRSFGNNRGIVRSLYNGSAGFTIDNSALDARTYSLTGIATPNPAYNRMQGMVSFGGPLRIPHLVRYGPAFYIGYQFARNRNVQIQSGLVPTPAERNGDLSQTPGQIHDPANNLPFEDNRIPDNHICGQARALLHLYPLPNFSGSARYNYQVPVTGVTRQDGVFTNLSKSIGRKDQITGTFSLQSTRATNQTLMGFTDTTRSLGTDLSVNWQHNFSPRFINTLAYKFSRQSGRTIPFFENRENISGMAGIAGNNQEALNWGPPNLIFFSGLASLSDAVPSSSHNQAGSLTASSFWNHGNHSVTFGGEYRRQQINLISQQNPRGSFTFTGASTLGPSPGMMISGARNDFAGFLLGIPDTVAIAFGNADKYLRSSVYNMYVADDWRMKPNLTLNAGIRWDYASPITELRGRLVNLDISPGFSAAAPVVANNPVGPLTGSIYPDSLIRPDRLAFQPRIGIAWKPLNASSMLVRGGYGIYYNASPYQSIAMEMTQQSPLSKSLSLQNAADTPLTIENGFNASPNTATNTFAVDPDLRLGYVHIWQLSLQLDLPAALQLTATYEGTRGKNALQEYLPNTYPAGAVNPCPSCPSGFRYRTSGGTSTRDAGTLQVRRRLQNGFTATVQYTFSKSMDDAAPGAAGTAGSVFIAQDWLNPGGERALSSFDRRHAAGLQFQYTTGMGIGGGMLLSGWRGALYKELTISGQISAGSGIPLTPVYPSTVLGTGVTGPVRPDTTDADIYDAPPGQHLNPAAYQAPAAGYWGNAGRNSIAGPSQFTLNASLSRTFRTGDRSSLSLSVQVNNALNHVTFASWNATVGSAQFGFPTAANSMRNVQTTIRWRF
jgi:hypothetical protein